MFMIVFFLLVFSQKGLSASVECRRLESDHALHGYLPFQEVPQPHEATTVPTPPISIVLNQDSGLSTSEIVGVVIGGVVGLPTAIMACVKIHKWCRN